MNRNAKGLILYPVAILMIFLLVLTFRDRLEESQTWNDRQLESALEEDEVAAVVITQNKEVPTGVLRVTLKDGDVKYVNVSDVNDAKDMIAPYSDVEVEITDVLRDSVFLTTLLPVLLTGVLLIFIFSMMNRQAGGGNAK